MGQRCANRACAPHFLLEMAIEHEDYSRLQILGAHADKLKFRENYSKHRQMYEDGEVAAAAIKKWEAKIKKTLKNQLLLQEEKEKVKRMEHIKASMKQ